MTAALPDHAAGGERVEDGGVGDLERSAPVELGDRLVGTSVGHTDDVLHGR